MLSWMQKFVKILLKFDKNLTKIVRSTYTHKDEYTWQSPGRVKAELRRGSIHGRRQPRHLGSLRWPGQDTVTLSGARSRLDQRRFSRPNTHFAAFFKIFKNIIFSQANLQKISKISRNFAKFWKKFEIFRKFAKFTKFYKKFAEFFTEFCKVL